MIGPLRARHRRMVTVLAVAVPAVFVGGLLARPALISGGGLGLERACSDGPVLSTAALVGWPGRVELRKDGPHIAVRLVDWRENGALPPDPLLLYTSSALAPGGPPAPDAVLLDARWGCDEARLPMAPEGGTLILYSAARSEVLATVVLAVSP